MGTNKVLSQRLSPVNCPVRDRVLYLLLVQDFLFQ